ncbi:MAG TPA: zf-HC2 domain-containing protein [Nitrospiria bacterium]|jgi:hypothetical protein
MKCDEIQNSLSDFFEGSLNSEKVNEIQTHLSACSRCQGEAEILTQTRKAVKNLPPIQPPPGFSQRVMGRIREDGENRKESPFWRRNYPAIKVIATVNAVALIGIIGLTLLLKRGEVPQDMQIARAPSVEKQTEAREDVALLEQKRKGLSESLKSPKEEEPKVKGEVLGLNKKMDPYAGPTIDFAQESPIQQRQMEASTEGSVGDTGPKEFDNMNSRVGITLTPDPSLIEKKIFSQELDDLIKKVGGGRSRLLVHFDKKEDSQTDSQVFMLRIPKDQVDRFKNGLNSLGTVVNGQVFSPSKESPQKTIAGLKKPSGSPQPIPTSPSNEDLEGSRSDSPVVQIKLTILYPKN